MDKKLYDWVCSLDEDKLSASITVELCRIPFQKLELFDDERFSRAWVDAMKKTNLRVAGSYICYKLYELIADRGKDAATILNIFNNGIGNDYYSCIPYLDAGEFSLKNVIEIAHVIGDTNFVLTALELIINRKGRVDWVYGYLFVRFFMAKKMYAEFERAFKYFFDDNLESFLFHIGGLYDAESVKTVVDIIDYCSEASERQKAKEDFFSRCVEFILVDFKHVKEERLKRLEYFKEIGFKVKNANIIMSVIEADGSDDLFESCRELLDDEAVLYLQKLTHNDTKTLYKRIDKLMKIKPGIKLSIDNYPFKDTVCLRGGPIYNVDVMVPILRKYKLFYSHSLAENEYLKNLSVFEYKVLYNVAEHLCNNYENAKQELAELFTETKDYKALNFIMQCE